jgi:hypothetical protein
VNERRRKLVPVSQLFLCNQKPITGDVWHIKCVEGMPEDATLIGLTYDSQRDTYYFCYQSAEWDEIPLGGMLPTFNLQFSQLHAAPFLEQAEKLIEAQYGADANRWLEEYRAFKKQTGWPSDS